MITYLEAIRLAQEKALSEDPRVFLYGQDIGNFGGAFKATKNLAKEFPGRVFDAPLSEDAIIGMAVGAAIEGGRGSPPSGAEGVGEARTALISCTSTSAREARASSP